MVKWRFWRLSDLQLGDKKVTLNHLDMCFLCVCFFSPGIFIGWPFQSQNSGISPTQFFKETRTQVSRFRLFCWSSEFRGDLTDFETRRRTRHLFQILLIFLCDKIVRAIHIRYSFIDSCIFFIQLNESYFFSESINYPIFFPAAASEAGWSEPKKAQHSGDFGAFGSELLIISGCFTTPLEHTPKPFTNRLWRDSFHSWLRGLFGVCCNFLGN